jgi:hypothetical protein
MAPVLICHGAVSNSIQLRHLIPFASTVADFSIITSGLLFRVLHVDSNVC